MPVRGRLSPFGRCAPCRAFKPSAFPPSRFGIVQAGLGLSTQLGVGSSCSARHRSNASHCRGVIIAPMRASSPVATLPPRHLPDGKSTSALALRRRFNGNKMITTSGGGALVCSSPEDANTVMWYATQARDSYPYYQHTAIGYNYRMSQPTQRARAETKLAWAMPSRKEEKTRSGLTSAQVSVAGR